MKPFFERRSSLSSEELDKLNDVVNEYFDQYIMRSFCALFTLAIQKKEIEVIGAILDPLTNLTAEECREHAKKFYSDENAQTILTYYHKLHTGKLTYDDNLIQILLRIHPLINLEKINKIIAKVISERTAQYTASLQESSFYYGT